MKTCGGSGGIAPTFLTSALDGGEWSTSRPCRFTPGKGPSGSRWMGGWVDPTKVKRIILYCRESNPGRPARSLSLYRQSCPGSCIYIYIYIYIYIHTHDVVSESSRTVIVITFSVKEDERGGQGHISASLLHQSAT
jgi:hypothetical protein